MKTIWKFTLGIQDFQHVHIVICGTGQPVNYDPRRLTFLGACFCGPFVWHVFELYSGPLPV